MVLYATDEQKQIIEDTEGIQRYTGKRDLVVGFQMYPYEWKIEAGTSKHIMPYQVEEEGQKNV